MSKTTKEAVERKLETAVVTQSQVENNEEFVNQYFEDAERHLVIEDGVLWSVDPDTFEKEKRVGDSSELPEYV